MRRSLADVHPVTVGEQPVQIQGAVREDYGAIFGCDHRVGHVRPSGTGKGYPPFPCFRLLHTP